MTAAWHGQGPHMLVSPFAWREPDGATTPISQRSILARTCALRAFVGMPGNGPAMPKTYKLWLGS